MVKWTGHISGRNFLLKPVIERNTEENIEGKKNGWEDEEKDVSCH
jgi:hypothetical protein